MYPKSAVDYEAMLIDALSSLPDTPKDKESGDLVFFVGPLGAWRPDLILVPRKGPHANERHVVEIEHSTTRALPAARLSRILERFRSVERVWGDTQHPRFALVTNAEVDDKLLGRRIPDFIKVFSSTEDPAKLRTAIESWILSPTTSPST